MLVTYPALLLSDSFEDYPVAIHYLLGVKEQRLHVSNCEIDILIGHEVLEHFSPQQSKNESIQSAAG